MQVPIDPVYIWTFVCNSPPIAQPVNTHTSLGPYLMYTLSSNTDGKYLQEEVQILSALQGKQASWTVYELNRNIHKSLQI